MLCTVKSPIYLLKMSNAIDKMRHAINIASTVSGERGWESEDK